ncbi:MAG: type II toxin-antitoxin system VapC family toxin [Oscillospiraceae bacterium]|nr:type II toxin-antitoxin system VapC family toxin [Oscillospiraceae bacterium]
MRCLLDTHTALWLFNEYENLSAKARSIIENKANTLYVSIVSAWEIAIKTSINKLEFEDGVEIFLSAVNNNPTKLINIPPQSLKIVEKLEFIHRDPFDRLLIATAMAENMTIITADKYIQKYEVEWVF